MFKRTDPQVKLFSVLREMESESTHIDLRTGIMQLKASSEEPFQMHLYICWGLGLTGVRTESGNDLNITLTFVVGIY